jgi:hypothetical protein
MSAELLKRKVTREIGIKERRTITDAIKEYVPESPNKKFYYKNYTDLVYKSVLGMSAKKYQLSMEIPDGKIRDYLTEQQLKKIAQIEDVVKTLLSIGKGYEEIKNILKK